MVESDARRPSAPADCLEDGSAFTYVTLPDAPSTSESSSFTLYTILCRVIYIENGVPVLKSVSNRPAARSAISSAPIDVWIGHQRAAGMSGALWRSATRCQGFGSQGMSQPFRHVGTIRGVLAAVEQCTSGYRGGSGVRPTCGQQQDLDI